MPIQKKKSKKKKKDEVKKEEPLTDLAKKNIGKAIYGVIDKNATKEARNKEYEAIYNLSNDAAKKYLKQEFPRQFKSFE